MEETRAASLAPLLQAIDLAVTVVDPSGRVVEWNPAAERIYGIARAEILGQDIMGFFSPASLIVRQVLETGKPVESTYHQPRPGIHVLITAAPLYAHGRLVGALAAERDITRMVELSAGLAAAQQRVSALEQRLAPQPPAAAAESDPFAAIRGQHPTISRAVALARKVAPTEASVLLLGESGTGKELFAHGIHRASARGQGPFVALNCGAIPASLFESELFGYAPGAFTGAHPKGQPGKLDLAQGGTLFLDEVGDLLLESQVKLLRFLEDRQFYRVGGSAPVRVDVRVVVATNRPLSELVGSGRFREDLYWRLNVVSMALPPLRQRMEDVPELAQLFLHEASLRHQRPISRVDPAVIQALMTYPWPGNIRELRNTIERLVVIAEEGVIGPDLLPPGLVGDGGPAEAVPGAPEASMLSDGTLQHAVTRAEREQILSALESARGNRSAAAAMLGVSRATFYAKCRRLGIHL